jgi:hypothetical protein
MKTKILKFKILQRVHRRFRAIQQNHQNSILLHETIPLKAKKMNTRRKYLTYCVGIENKAYSTKPLPTKYLLHQLA